MSSKISCQIICTLNDTKQRIYLDTIDDNTVNTSSSLSTHPIFNGDMVSDHMYKDQATMSIKGSFGLNSGSVISLGNGSSKLAEIQSTFESIKNGCVICEIIKMSHSSGSNVRFLRRTNMVLTSINWTEKINSLDFSFDFTQILTGSGSTYSSNNVDTVQTQTSLRGATGVVNQKLQKVMMND